jgi:hypothetical protein
MGWNAVGSRWKPFDLFAALEAQTSRRRSDDLWAKPLQLRLVIKRKNDEQAEAPKEARLRTLKSPRDVR